MNLKNIIKYLEFTAVLAMLLLGGSAQRSQAQSPGVCNFPSNATISSTDTSCEGKDVVIGGGANGATVTVSGQHQFNNLTIRSNGRLTHMPLTANDYDRTTWFLTSSGTNPGTDKLVNLTVENTTTIEAGGSIVADAKGYLGARTTGAIDCQGHDARFGHPACDFGDGPGGGVGIDNHNENWAGGSGASFGGFGGFGGNIDGTSSMYYPKSPYNFSGFFNDSNGIYHGSGGGTSRMHELTPPLVDINGGAGGGAIYLSTGELKGSGEIHANGEDGQVNSILMSGGIIPNFYDGHASGGGSGGLVYIKLTGDTTQSSAFCADVSGGKGLDPETASPTMWGKVGSKSILVNQGTDCSASATNTISVFAKGGNGPYTWLVPAVPPAVGLQRTVGAGGGGGRVYVSAQPAGEPFVKEINASLTVDPVLGVQPLNNVSLTGDETDSYQVQDPFEWQFSCDDSTVEDAINGELLFSGSGNKPFTPVNKCNYPESGMYFPKVVVSKPADAQGEYGISSYTARVYVYPEPTVTLTAVPSSIDPGASSTLSWTSENADSLIIDNDVGDVNPHDRGSVSVSPTTTTTYKITATNQEGGSATATATVTVNSVSALSVTLSADPDNIFIGDSSTLTWTSKNAVSLEINNGVGPVAPFDSGSVSVSPTTTTLYTITATDQSGGSATATAKVTINQPLEGSLDASPSTGDAPLNNVTLTGTISSGQKALTWQFSCNDSSATDTISNPIRCLSSGSVFCSQVDSPVTPDEKCNYVTAGNYIAKMLVSKTGFSTIYRTRVISANDIAPTVTLTAVPPSIDPGASSTLSWTSKNAVNLVIDNAVGDVNPHESGSVSVSPVTTTTYKITATGKDGSVATDTTTVTVNSVPAPTVNLEAIPDRISAGDSSTLSWRSTDAVSLTINNGVGTVGGPAGLKSVTPASTTTYKITATGKDGSVATDTATVTVDPVPAPTVELKADPASISSGATSTLSWKSTNALSLAIDNGIGDVLVPDGTRLVAPTTTTTYKITATSKSGKKVTATAKVTVIPVIVQPECSTGSIKFEEGGLPIKIKGSLVADCIDFKSRNRNGARFSVTIYNDQRILYSVLPGFESIMSIIINK